MKSSWTRLLRSVYRKEPVSTFIVTVGAVDAVIGGVGDRWSLVAVGLGTIGLAIVVRWWRLQQRRVEPSGGAPIHYLPTRSSEPPLPMLSASRKQPPTDRR